MTGESKRPSRPYLTAGLLLLSATSPYEELEEGGYGVIRDIIACCLMFNIGGIGVRIIGNSGCRNGIVF